MNTESIIQINNLSKKFKGFELDIPSLELPKGFAIALIGENGAGKSTLMNILAGVRLDYKGIIDYFNGQSDDAYILSTFGYLVGYMTVNISMNADLLPYPSSLTLHQAAIWGIVFVLLGIIISSVLRVLVYKKPISSKAMGSSLRKHMQ